MLAIGLEKKFMSIDKLAHRKNTLDGETHQRWHTAIKENFEAVAVPLDIKIWAENCYMDVFIVF